MLFSLVGLSDMVFFIGELSVRIGPCDMVFSIIGDFGMVFSIVGLSVTDSPSWTPPLWMIFALAGSSGMAFSIKVRPTQTPAGNVCLFCFVAACDSECVAALRIYVSMSVSRSVVWHVFHVCHVMSSHRSPIFDMFWSCAPFLRQF